MGGREGLERGAQTGTSGLRARVQGGCVQTPTDVSP